MLTCMSLREITNWALYAREEPFGEQRADFRIAQLCALMANINRDAKQHPEPYAVSDFMPSFDDDKRIVNAEDGATVHPETLAFLFGAVRAQRMNKGT